MSDYSKVARGHEEIDQRLTHWARWVKVGHGRGSTMPMFRMYQSKARQWETDPHIHIELDEHECLQTEKAVSSLPPPQRTAVRWAYAFPWVPVAVVRRELGVSREGLGDLIDAGRVGVRERLVA